MTIPLSNVGLIAIRLYESERAPVHVGDMSGEWWCQ